MAPVAFGIFVILAWSFIVNLFGVPSYVFPSPYEIMLSALKHEGVLRQASVITFAEAASGLLIGFFIATIVAILSSQIAVVRKALAPYLVVLQTTPVPAVAPLFVLWFGEGSWSRIMASFAICVVPMAISITNGLLVEDGGRVELYKVVGHGRMWRFLNVTAPLAFPSVLTALQFGAMLSVVGAVVGELVTADAGIGYVVIQASYSLDTPLLFSAICCAAIIGFTMYSIISIMAGIVGLERFYLSER